MCILVQHKCGVFHVFFAHACVCIGTAHMWYVSTYPSHVRDVDYSNWYVIDESDCISHNCLNILNTSNLSRPLTPGVQVF